MEEGYLTVPLHYGIHSIKWSHTPEHHILDGDILFDPKQHGGWTKLTVGFAFTANRCRECMCVLFFYAKSEPPNPSYFPSSEQPDSSWTR